MSRRFGRNQRRQLREQLAEAQERAAECAIERDREIARGARNRHTIERVAAVLGPEFAALPPRLIEHEPPQMEAFMDWDKFRSEPIDPHPPSECALVETALDTLKMRNSGHARVVHDRLTRCVHVRLAVAGRPYAYAVSRESYYHLPPAWLADRIAESLRPQIEDAIVSDRAGQPSTEGRA